MTNLELAKVVEDLTKKLDECIQVIGKIGQKQITFEQQVAAFRDEEMKVRVEIDALKLAVNNIMDHIKVQVTNY